jgi:hypothetical protein
MVLPVDVSARAGRPMPTRVLARMPTTGIYLMRGVPRDLQRATRVRVVSEETTLRWVLLQAQREYAAGTWTPQPDDTLPRPAHDQCGSPDGPAQLEDRVSLDLPAHWDRGCAGAPAGTIHP